VYATKENSEVKQEVAYLSSRLKRTNVSEKMIEEDLSRFEESAIKSTYKFGVGFERCEDKGEKSAPKFVPNSNCHKEEESLKPTKTHYPSNPKPSFIPRRGVKKNTPNPCEEVCICMFCGRAGHLDEFSFSAREWRRGVWTMPETHFMMSLLIFHLTFLFMLRLVFLMDQTITYMVLVHETVTLCLDTLVSTHTLIVVFVSRIGMVFLLKVSILTLSPVPLTVHAFSIVAQVPLAQMVRCKGL
jgi:hypothetical protein